MQNRSRCTKRLANVHDDGRTHSTGSHNDGLELAGGLWSAINQYVLHLQESFLSRLGVSLEGETIAGEVVGWTRRQKDEVSKALTLRSDRASQLAQALQEKGFQCDSRHGSYLRLGFDICHSEADALALADALRQVAR